MTDKATSPDDGELQFGGDTGLFDRDWQESDWNALLQKLIGEGLVRSSHIAALVLGHLNPSQVGTSLASSAGFKRRYGKGKVMPIVMDWFYQQSGLCTDCESRLELQTDHHKARKDFADRLDADYIENIFLLCRRCNVLKRPSHEHGRKKRTFLTAESALMWTLLEIRPRNLQDFKSLCRLYGMTMADVRMQEAWAMQHWLRRADPEQYVIDDDSGKYDVLLWPDGALTRRPSGLITPGDPDALASCVAADCVIGFVTAESGDYYVHQRKVSGLPFSTYRLGPRPRQDIAIEYHADDRKLSATAPRGREIVDIAIRSSREHFKLKWSESRGRGRSVKPDFDRRAMRKKENGRGVPSLHVHT